MLASSLGRRDEKPNILLAQKIVEEKSEGAITELIELCKGKDRKLAGDAIKVIYEIGYLTPGLLSDRVHELIPLLDTKHNRLQWGTMVALSTLSAIRPEALFDNLPAIIGTMHSGSVISKDAGVKLLVDLCSDTGRSEQVVPILLEFIQDAPINQFPTYCQRIGSLDLGNQAPEFAEIIRSRLPEFEAYPPKRKKLMSVLNQFD